MQKVGCGVNFESGNQGYSRRQKQAHEAHMVYLIKLTHQKDANLILTRKFFTIAIKAIQFSSQIIKRNEFIKATFSSENFFFLKQTTYLLLEAKTPSYFITYRVKLPYAILQQNKFQDQTLSMKNRFLE